MRAIIHADLDAFFASVEQLDDPALRGKPVVVGGSPEERSVVAAASYEARRYGIRSAMPMSRALRLCPQAIRVPLHFQRYQELSARVMGIFRSLTPLVEPLSLDEAFLDVSASLTAFTETAALAQRLKSQVKEETGLTISIGVADNKSAAKIASDMGKPDGLVVVQPEQTAAFLAPLPVQTLWGIGPRTAQALTSAGVQTIGDLAQADTALLERLLGSRGPFLLAMAQGRDNRPVETERERKSIGAERTFTRDLPPGPELAERLDEIAAEVSRRLKAASVRAATVDLKLRYSDFRTISRQRSLAMPVMETEDIVRIAEELMEQTVTRGDRFRLLGIHASRLTPEATASPETDAQLSLWQAGE